MRILVTGANGLLGQKLLDKLLNRKGVTVLGVSASANRNPHLPQESFAQADITDMPHFAAIAQRFHPTHIVHAAAMTSVERCEQQQERCLEVNVVATEKIATFCQEQQIHLTFLSTDFVFDGIAGPYRENDAPRPCNNYGISKQEAEKRILASGAQAAILRTILVYGVIADKGRSNIVLWVKDNLSRGDSISVVCDQWRMPTWVDDLADACIRSMERQATGIYHISSDTMFSILEIAEQVACYWNLDKTLIRPVTARELGQDQNRPRTTGFYLEKAKTDLGFYPTPLVESFNIIEKQLLIFQSHE
ncbi:SDR family oxidoreductase [Sphingobacterium suaedae]|uniref:dTDP-4-dehydrorhamnose reductase n=1 Tax=Sphingobacterium suaedae TaxID=1686402 RepID=A0ABW5KJ08_9SPHI